MKLLRMIFAARRELPRLWPLVRDTRVPLWGKIAAALAALLVVSPLNVLGDIPFVGMLDDVALLLLVSHYFVAFAERRTAAVTSGNS